MYLFVLFYDRYIDSIGKKVAGFSPYLANIVKKGGDYNDVVGIRKV